MHTYPNSEKARRNLKNDHCRSIRARPATLEVAEETLPSGAPALLQQQC